MKIKNLQLFVALSLTSFVACSQNEDTDSYNLVEKPNQADKIIHHDFSGWYCPDNLNGFPAVDLKKWKSVPTVSGRLPTKEETQNGTSLIYVDREKYPSVVPLDITLPKLATFYCVQSKREEHIIVIQAIKVGRDSIVGFRYLNGGNGSAKLNEVDFLADAEIDAIPSSRFVSYSITIKANSETVWKQLKKSEFNTNLQQIFDQAGDSKADEPKTTVGIYNYPNSGELTASFSNLLFGNYYIQNNYSEKFLLLENNETKHTELKIVCGPFGDDYEKQKSILITWAVRLKASIEKKKVGGC